MMSGRTQKVDFRWEMSDFCGCLCTYCEKCWTLKTSIGNILIREGGPYHTMHVHLLLTCQHDSQPANEMNMNFRSGKKNLKLACLCMCACEYIYCTSLRVAHQHTEPANWASWFRRSPDTLQSSSNIQPSLFGLRSREDSYWWRYTNRTHALSSRCANAAKRLQICKSVSAECVKNTSRNPLVYWKYNEHLRTLKKTEICSWGGPDMWVYPPAAVA